MSEIKVNKISPATSTDITLGDSGDTFTVPSGATIVNSGTATGFGGGLIKKVTHFTWNTRLVTSSSVNAEITNFVFTKDNDASTTYILAQGQFPIGDQSADNCGEWAQMDTNSEPTNDTDPHLGINFIPGQGTHSGGFYLFKKFTGLTAASHTLYIGYNTNDSTSQSIGVFNPNSTEDVRNQQKGSTCTIWEIGV